ncbi:uncharacterized protein LOC109284143 [Alligator mississippiensis]|uniref:uncharacterized protein LOC109284143 n=1 Tax=Alligator mississippiensis TaxID=8496 RepID=UPI0009074F88|nr:uncharacterized protein LOC109284143 [Alligator mississippiensis]XP_059586667.1 uncharacterized protein LOC109284143 [Alligator mississippiensis]
MLRKLFSPINAQERMLSSGKEVQREGQMLRQLQVPKTAQLRKVRYHTGAVGLKPSASPQDILIKPRAVSSSITLPQIGRHLVRKPFLSSYRKIFPEGEAPLPAYTIEPQSLQSPAGIYADTFLKDSYDELMNKCVPSQNLLAWDSAIRGSDPSRFSTDLVDLVLSELSRCQATAQQPSEDRGLFPDIDTLTDKIIHSSLSDLLHKSASKVALYENMKSNKSGSAEGLSVLRRREITDHQPLAKAPPSALYKLLYPGKTDEKLCKDAPKSTSQCQSPTPSTPEVCNMYSENIISKLLSDTLPPAACTSSSKEKKMELAGFDLLHLKVISRGMAKISEDDDICSQHADHPHATEHAMIQTIADLVYDKLLAQFQSQVNMQNCLRNGCLVISEALCDLVFQEISGSPLQSSLSGESSLHHHAEAVNIVGDTPRDVTEPLKNPNSFPSDLGKIVPRIIEKLAGNLLSMVSSLFSIEHLDAEKTLLLKDVTKKSLQALQVLLSKQQRNMNEHISEEDLYTLKTARPWETCSIQLAQALQNWLILVFLLAET